MTLLCHICLRIHDSGLFAWISQTALSRTYMYVIIAAMQDGPSLHIEEPQPIPYQKAQFYSLLYIYLIVMRYLYLNTLVPL